MRPLKSPFRDEALMTLETVLKRPRRPVSFAALQLSVRWSLAPTSTPSPRPSTVPILPVMQERCRHP